MALSLGIISIGMFFSVGRLYSVAAFIIGSALPLLMNVVTAVSARWFGPRGRVLSTMILISALYFPNLIGEYVKNGLSPGKLPIAVLTLLFALICLALLYNKPKFRPTFSEEDKNSAHLKNNFTHFNFRNQIQILIQNRNYMMFAISAVLMLININELNKTLVIFYR